MTVRKALAEVIRKTTEANRSLGGEKILLAVLGDALGLLADEFDAMRSGRLMMFEGPHDPVKSYQSGAVVQRSGSVWVAMTATSETPGASAHWRRLGA